MRPRVRKARNSHLHQKAFLQQPGSYAMTQIVVVKVSLKKTDDISLVASNHGIKMLLL